MIPFQRLLRSGLAFRGRLLKQALLTARAEAFATVRATVVPVMEDASGSTTDGLTFDTAAIDFVKNEPLVIAVASSQTGATGQTPTVTADPSGLALAFTQVGNAIDVTASPARRMTIWRLTPSTSFSAIIRIGFTVTSQTSCVWIPIHCPGAATIRQVSTAVTGTGTAAAANALAAFEHANNVCLAFFLTATATIAPADGEAELSEQAQASTTLNLQAQWKVNDVSAAATTSSAVAYAAISMELAT